MATKTIWIEIDASDPRFAPTLAQRIKNRKKISSASYLKNKASQIARAKAWAKANPERFRSTCRSRMRKKRIQQKLNKLNKINEIINR